MLCTDCGTLAVWRGIDDGELFERNVTFCSNLTSWINLS